LQAFEIKTTCISVAYMQQSNFKKIVEIDSRAAREIKRFPKEAIKEIRAAIEALSKLGFLRGPKGKKLGSGLFEIRANCQGQFRSFYAYLDHPKIIVLSAFQKKTNKTPKKEIHKAEQRLLEYL
jgi:phage-related protein